MGDAQRIKMEHINNVQQRKEAHEVEIAENAALDAAADREFARYLRLQKFHAEETRQKLAKHKLHEATQKMFMNEEENQYRELEAIRDEQKAAKAKALKDRKQKLAEQQEELKRDLEAFRQKLDATSDEELQELVLAQQ